MDIIDIQQFFEICDSCINKGKKCDECMSLTVADIRKPALFEPKVAFQGLREIK